MYPKHTTFFCGGEPLASRGDYTQIVESRCEILLLDNTAISSNPDLIDSLLLAIPELRVVLIGLDEKEEDFLNTVRSGVFGYILRQASAMDLVNAMRAVARGEAVCHSN